LLLACVPSRDTPSVASASSSAVPAASPAPSEPRLASETAKPPEIAPAPPAHSAQLELPRGGRTIFPTHQLVGFCGTPGAPALGLLAGNLAAKAEKLQGYADQYASSSSRKPLPVFELIAVVVQGWAGADGKYRQRVFDTTVDEYLQAARQAKGLLLLNIQPGRSDFLTEVKRFDKYLTEPDVGVALDPEWAVRPKEKPNTFYGQAPASSINDVAEYLSSIVAAHDLPEKALVFHQVNGYVVKDESVIRPYPGVAVIKSVDGTGPMGTKIITYNYLMKFMTAGVHPGFKLFFDEDRAKGNYLMSPAEVMKLKPQPEYVMYE
jgi:hypothetical protein